MKNFTRKYFIKILGGTVTAPSVLSLLSFQRSISDEAPNILLLISDDSSPFSYGAYGNEVCQTPNIDRLASEGMRFSRAYCSSPQCSPARASI